MSDRRISNLAVAFVLSGALHAMVLSGAGPGAGAALPEQSPRASAQAPKLTVTLSDPVASIDRPIRVSLSAPLQGAAAANPMTRPTALQDPAATAPIFPLPIPEERYYTAREVDTRARPVGPIDLNMNAPLWGSQTSSGRIVLKLWIDEKGKIEKARPLSSEMSLIVTAHAWSTFARAHFAPAILHGAPVRTLMVVEITYAGRLSRRRHR